MITELTDKQIAEIANSGFFDQGNATRIPTLLSASWINKPFFVRFPAVRL